MDANYSKHLAGMIVYLVIAIILAVLLVHLISRSY
jgi:hypothetical protein